MVVISSDNLRLLDKEQQRALELKYRGFRYAEISADINVKQETIENWFSKRGMLFFPFKEYERQENATRKQMVTAIFNRSIEYAARIVVAWMMDQPITSINPKTKESESKPVTASMYEGAKEVLDRTIGQSKLQIEDVTADSELVLMVREYYEEYGKSRKAILIKRKGH